MPATRSTNYEKWLQARLDVLEVGSSFLVATTAEPITVGKEWVQISGLLLGPQNFPHDTPDIVVSDTGDSLVSARSGRYHLLSNCQFVSATADGWFEPAITGHMPDEDVWPGDVDRGHTGTWLPAAALGWDEATLGCHVSSVWPCTAADEITTWAKFATADGLGTVDVSVLTFVSRL